MQVLKSLAAGVNAQLYLHAGSHLGAILHGQPIPWDDDTDVFMDIRVEGDIWEACSGNGTIVHSSGLRLRCVKFFNAFKVWLHYDGMEKLTHDAVNWYSPFVDLFFYTVEDERIWEIWIESKEKGAQNYALGDYFPSRPYYFGGKKANKCCILLYF